MTAVMMPSSAVAPGALQTIEKLPQQLNLAFVQGDDFRFTLVLMNEEDGSPFDLSGAEPRSQIRQQPAAGVAAEFEVEAGGDENNEISLHLTHEQSTKLPVGRLMWDCQITQAGEVTTITAGSVAVSPEVTR